jgi:hypothetical protein
MRQQWAFILMGLLWASFFAIPLRPIAAWAGTPQGASQVPSAAYLHALQTANAFLWAWLTRDADEGLRLISNHLRTQIHDDERLRQFVVGLSNPRHQAFEIGRGCRHNTNRYAFPVTLYELYSGEQVGARYLGILEVEKQSEVWRVNRLPRSPDTR